MTDESVTDALGPTGQGQSLHTVGQVIDKRISRWQYELLRGNPTEQAASMATLARLRRGAGKPAGSVADIFAFTLAPEFAGPQAPDEPTEREVAAHIALTLYALHQQSRTQPMHRRGRGLGRAIRQLHPDEPTSPPDPVTRRFQMLVTADSLDELTHHARGIVQLLRSAQPNPVPLDYGLLADELRLWQRRPNGPEKVRRAWARDYYRPRKQATSGATPPPADDSTIPEGN